MLSNYSRILSGEKRPKFMDADLSSLEKRAMELSSPCILCERRCGALRLEGERGYCGVTEPRIASEFLHFGEESILVPSHTIFFSGCNFRCVFCQNWDISQYPDSGIYVEPEAMAERIERRWPYSKNVNWVGGEPTPNLQYIISVLEHLNVPIPQVWNSNMYLTEEAMEVVNEITDLYLTDFKYGNDGCALRLSNAPKYWETVTRNHLMAEGDMIIRHLVLPNHLECCTKPVLEWIKENRPDAVVNVMAQYRPEYMASKYGDISRGLRNSEYSEAVRYARELELRLI